MVTQPQLVGREPGTHCGSDDLVRGTRVLHVDAEIDRSDDTVEVLRECRHVGRQFAASQVGDGDTAQTSTDDSVVLEHDDAVLRQPCISLDTVRAELEGQLERVNRVLPGVGPCAPVGERDGVFPSSGQALLHARRIEPPSYAERVFNLSGSEIIFLLLAGLVVLGPERLPGVLRTVGRIYGQVRGVAQGLEKEIKDTFAEPVSDLKQTAQQIRAGFGEVDTEPSPPMRPEQARNPDEAPEGETTP